jgi:hypothetical protein
MTRPALDALALWVDERPYLKLKQLSTVLEKQLAIAVMQQTISSALTKIGFTIKLLRALPESRNSPNVLLARYSSANQFLADHPQDRRDVI